MFAVVRFVQVADCDTTAGAGMDEPAVLQVNAYVRGTALPASVVEEDEVAFAQIPFALFLAIVLALLFGGAV